MEDMNELLVRSGLRTVILVSQTGMSRKQITAIRKRLGLRGNAESGPLPQAESLLSSRAMSLEGSLFMHSYLMIAKDPRVEVDILAVIAAHNHYLECHGDIRGGKIDLDHFLELDRAWVLARDYRGMIVGMRSCSCCHLEFVASINDRRHNCPVCSGVTVEVQNEYEINQSRTVADLIEISDKIKIMMNWGMTESELCNELGLSAGELEIAKALGALSSTELRQLADREQESADILEILRETGSLKSMVA
jgi:flagellar transcriptional activator FlhC